jgi:putative aldouronate transport system permease protein
MGRLRHETRRERFFVFWVPAILILISLTALYPVVNTAALSFSDGDMAVSGEVFLWPKKPNLESWQLVLSSRIMWRSLANTIFVAGVGSLLSLIFTAVVAYPLANRRFRLRKLVMILLVVTMVFRYPIIPYYLVVRSYGLMNKLWVLIITHLLIEYNIIIMRTFFIQLPDELEEAAVVEGANHLQILFRVILPISTPVLATLGLFYAVTYWNLFLHPMLFLQKPELLTLQPRLRAMLQAVEVEEARVDQIVGFSLYTAKAATIMFATIPILFVYPFLQKHFVKGALLGSLKG